MAQLWPNEVCRKFKAKNRFKNLKLRFWNGTRGGRRENSCPTHVDRAVDRPIDRGVDLPVDLPVDRGAASSEPGCTRLGSRLAWRAGSGSFLDLTGLNQSRVNLRV